MRKLTGLLFLLLCTSCSSPQHGAERDPDAFPFAEPPRVREHQDWYLEKIDTDSAVKEPTSLVRLKVPDDLIDIQGVGDSGWVFPATPKTAVTKPPPPQFDKAIDSLDPDHVLFQGDLNFLNFETVLGVECPFVRQSVDYYFLSHPDIVRQAFNKGFNVFNFANNHGHDCDKGFAEEGGPMLSGPLMTEAAMIEAEKYPILWNGVGKGIFQVFRRTLKIRDRDVTIAFGAFVLQSWETEDVATVDIYKPESLKKIDGLFESFNAAPADIKILSIHTQDSTGDGRPEGDAFRNLKLLSEIFIQKYDGDIVFGEGPHTWGGVRVLRKANNKQGVIFTSLGNFIHQGLATDSENFIARVLLSPTNGVKEVQVIPFSNRQTSISFTNPSIFNGSPGAGSAVNANFNWKLSKTMIGKQPATLLYGVFK